MATLVTVTFWTDTGLVEDQVVNTFALGNDLTGIADTGGGAQPSVTNMNNIAVLLSEFYNTFEAPGTEAIKDFLSLVLDDAANRVTVRFYNINGNMFGLSQANGGIPTGSPIGQRTFTLVSNATAGRLPSEVAVVLTLEGVGRQDAPVEAPDGSDMNLLLDRPKQRRTGRLYIGPLGIPASTLIGNVMRPNASLRTNLRQAAVRLEADIRAEVGANLFWGVWSRADGIVRSLEAFSTDDALDTQRRRGEGPTARERTLVS